MTRELDVFVTRRLLTTDTDNSSVVVGVAHEAFLSAWPPLAQAIDDNASALRARRTVEQAATEWNDNGHPPARLWERGQLAATLADTGAHLQDHDVVTDRVDLSSTARAFLRASIRRDRLRRGRASTVLSVLLVLALVAAGFAVAQQRAAEQQRDVAVSRQVAGQALELRDTNPALAAQLSLAAYRLVPTTEARSSLLSTVATLYATRLTGHTSHVKGVAFSPDGHTLATGSDDKTVRLWDVSDPRQPHPLGTLTGHINAVNSVAFSPDGHTLATASLDTTARLSETNVDRVAARICRVTPAITKRSTSKVWQRHGGSRLRLRGRECGALLDQAARWRSCSSSTRRARLLTGCAAAARKARSRADLWRRRCGVGDRLPGSRGCMHRGSCQCSSAVARSTSSSARCRRADARSVSSATASLLRAPLESPARRSVCAVAAARCSVGCSSS
ncbi:MAG: hypothetical protein WCF33_20775 [Pseudonocardiaceae bacterium]